MPLYLLLVLRATAIVSIGTGFERAFEMCLTVASLLVGGGGIVAMIAQLAMLILPWPIRGHQGAFGETPIQSALLRISTSTIPQQWMDAEEEKLTLSALGRWEYRGRNLLLHSLYLHEPTRLAIIEWLARLHMGPKNSGVRSMNIRDYSV